MKTLTFIAAALLCQLFSTCLSAQTATAPAKGNGTSLDPYQIENLENLYWLSQNSAQWVAGKSFIQTADIDASPTAAWFDNGSEGYYGFPMIGGNQTLANSVSGSFNGNYDGQGYSIRNLYINRPGSYVGLFGRLGTSEKTIKNIRLVNPSVQVPSGTLQHIGLLIGDASNFTTVQNIHIEGGSLAVTGAGWFVGGLAGNVGNDCRFSNSTVDATITVGSNGLMIGGFVGRLLGGNTTINDCKAGGTITTASNRIGGFAGQSEHSSGHIAINRCYSTTTIYNTTGYSGGFIGLVFGSISFTDCAATGNMNNVTGSTYGGFYGITWSVNVNAAFVRCYTTTAIQGGSWKGGFGSDDYSQANVTYNACLWNTTTSGINTGMRNADRTGLSGATTSQLQSASTFIASGWDFVNESTNGTSDYWTMLADVNNNYPVLRHHVRVWTGNADNNWNNSANWLNGYLPDDSSIVQLAGDAPYLPVVSGNIRLNVFDFNKANMILELNNDSLILNEIIGYSSNRYVQVSGTGAVSITIPSGKPGFFPVGNSAYNPVTITNQSGAADVFSVNVLDEVYVNGSDGATAGAPRVARTWNINKTDGNNGAIDFKFQWNVDEIEGALAIPTLYHYNNGWEEQTGSTTSTATSLSYTGYTGTFSPFAVIEKSASLPVRWLGFTAEKQQEKVSLKWSTTSETGSAQFHVQHSPDGIRWETIGTKKAAGNSATILHYSFIHSNPVKGNNHYRLLQQDIDGRQEYSKIVVLNLPTIQPGLSIYPNPVIGNTLTIQARRNEKISVYNSVGAKVMDLVLKEGSQTLHLGHLANGTYFLKGNNETITFIKK